MTITTQLRAGAALMAITAMPAFAAAPGDGDRPTTGIAEGSDIVVTATRANIIAPVTASLTATQPQAIVSRSFIEDSLPATADFNAIALISPSVSNFGNNNGIGLSESKAQIRGFQDGEYNVTFDGVPFGDQNDPSHHSNTFFPSNTVETLVVERGPGNASNLGIATSAGRSTCSAARRARISASSSRASTAATTRNFIVAWSIPARSKNSAGRSS